MKILDVIDEMKRRCGAEWNGRALDDASTRDQVLFGDFDQECTGVAVCIYPSIEVIKHAAALGCNCIVTHEALFWNHGDYTEWLRGNTAYQAKRDLLTRHRMCVWRNHDHVHAGVMIDGELRDGIFYGVAHRLGWLDYMVDPHAYLPQDFVIPACSARELGAMVSRAFGIAGIRFVGDPACEVSRVHIPLHIMGRQGDSDLIARMQDEDINALIALELVDFTACEYVRDAAELGENRCIFSVGHFNVEQLGMDWYAGYLREKLGARVPVHMVPVGDMYRHFA